MSIRHEVQTVRAVDTSRHRFLLKPSLKLPNSTATPGFGFMSGLKSDLINFQKYPLAGVHGSLKLLVSAARLKMKSSQLPNETLF